MDDAFVQIDRDGWIDALKLRERGADQGAMNLPRADASTAAEVAGPGGPATPQTQGPLGQPATQATVQRVLRL